MFFIVLFALYGYRNGYYFFLKNGVSYPGVFGALVCVVQFIARNVFFAVVLFGELRAGRRHAAFVNLRTNFLVVQLFANFFHEFANFKERIEPPCCQGVAGSILSYPNSQAREHSSYQPGGYCQFCWGAKFNSLLVNF